MINAEHFLLIGAILLFVAVMAGKVAYRFNAPALLLFLAVGLFFGYDILSFNSPELTQFIGMISLCIILFSGGMDTKFSEIRPVLAEGITLATAGVLMTALLLGCFVYLVSPWIGVELSFPLSMLLAATISSTDSASVFRARITTSSPCSPAYTREKNLNIRSCLPEWKALIISMLI
jgi:cell volume regulation protein A